MSGSEQYPVIVALPAGTRVEDPSDWGPCISVAEWKLMYLRGIPPEQIARICRVPIERIRRVLRRFEKTYPELVGKRLILIDRPAPPTPAQLQRKPSRPSWDARLREAKEFHQRNRRLPRILSKNPIEQRLAVWVAGQRKQIRSGSISNDRQKLLRAALGDWVGLQRPVIETNMWDQRLNEVAHVINREGRPPRFRRIGDRSENTLATWLVTQRGIYRRGTLDPARRTQLDVRLPGWDNGWR